MEFLERLAIIVATAAVSLLTGIATRALEKRYLRKSGKLKD